MTSAILLKSHLVVDLFLWQILLGIAGVVVTFGVVYSSAYTSHCTWRRIDTVTVTTMASCIEAKTVRSI